MIEKRKRLSIIVPVYFNAESLPILGDRLADFERQLLARNVDLELIFVNDGSKDNSQEELLKLKLRRPTTKVIKHTRNFGAVAASRTGFRYATGDAFLVLSADLQDPVSTVLEMVDRWIQGKNFILAVRKSRSDPPTTKALAWLYYRIIDKLVIKGYPKNGFDLMLAEKPVLDLLIQATKNVNPNMFAYSLGFEPTVITYQRLQRDHGKSRWSFTKKLRHFINTITGLSAVPIRIMSGVGVIVSILSFGYGTYITAASLFGTIPVPGYTTIVVLITLFSGLILVALGIIGEYLWRIFEVVNRNIESVVEESIL